MHGWGGVKKKKEKKQKKKRKILMRQLLGGGWVATHGGVLNNLSRRVHGRKQF
jgi:hypothetical protein